jgi:hypothetical protein
MLEPARHWFESCLLFASYLLQSSVSKSVEQDSQRFLKAKWVSIAPMC